MAGGLMKFSAFIQKALAWGSAGNPKQQPPPPARPKAEAGGETATQILLSEASADAIRQARLDALAAERDVANVSQTHLATLLASPPRHRMVHLNDPELTVTDRAELANSVRSALPISFRLKFLRRWPTALVRGLQLTCGYKCFLAMVVATACAVPFALAWRSTGTRLVGSDATWIVDWVLPDGTSLHGSWNAHMPAIAMRANKGTVILRHWLNGRGYATTEVDEHWLLGHSFTYVAAPVGATGTARPASR
jgi:hypothetical protein